MNILLTGSTGFIGSNLSLQLKDRYKFKISVFKHNESLEELKNKIRYVDCILHFAGVNISDCDEDYMNVNYGFTKKICETVIYSKKRIPIIYASSIHAEFDNEYGKSKAAAEQTLKEYSDIQNCETIILRLPHVIGKWCRPNYNSVVATFCNNIANNLPIEIHDPKKIIRLLHVDDLTEQIYKIIINKNNSTECQYPILENLYPINIQELADKIKFFKAARKTLNFSNLGKGLDKILYSTYITYLDKNNFSYPLKENKDERGNFVELLKTNNSGQFSFFTINPKQIRGQHYHHTKTEKFLVISGTVYFRFKHLITGEYHEIEASDEFYQIIDTIPGWSHDVINNSTTEAKIIVWANEIFNENNPDTIKSTVVDE